MTLSSVVMFMRVYLASIDFEDCRLSHRFGFLYHRFTWRPLRPRLGLGTVEPHPSPPSQVDRCHPVPVHYDSTVSAPELTSQSLVRLESLPASRTSHTRTSSLRPRQMNDGQADPTGLVFYLPLSFIKAPPVHPTTILPTLTVTLPVETAYAPDILQNYCFPPLNRYCDNRLCNIVEQMTSPSGSTHSIIRGYDSSNPHIVSFERGNYAHRSTGYTQSL